MRGNYKPKLKKFESVCQYCNTSFLSADKRCKTCSSCKQPRICKCGCLQLVKTPGKYYIANHVKRGKTYKEIYGTSTPKCGYQKGDNNIAKRDDIRQKISEGVKRSYTDELLERRYNDCYWLSHKYISFIKRFAANNGDKFRSRFEVQIANLLIENNIHYAYEVPIRMINNKHKIVDFVANGYFIEVTGYAFDDWKQSFNNKIQVLSKSIDNAIIIITYEKNISELAAFILENDLKNIILISSECLTDLIQIITNNYAN